MWKKKLQKLLNIPNGWRMFREKYTIFEIISFRRDKQFGEQYNERNSNNRLMDTDWFHSSTN